MAGASSAALSCPAELLMIQQQSTGQSLVVAARRTGLRQLYRGLVRSRHTASSVHSYACSLVRSWPQGYLQIRCAHTKMHRLGRNMAQAGVDAFVSLSICLSTAHCEQPVAQSRQVL